MRIQVVSKNGLEITDAMRSAAEEKLHKLEKFFAFKPGDNCRVVISTYKKKTDGVSLKVEVTIFSSSVFRAEVRGEDYYDALYDAIDKLEGQIRKFRTQREKKKSLVRPVSEADEPEVLEPAREKQIFVEKLSFEDAVTAMKNLGHSFFLYLDEETEKVTCIYRRYEGGIGLIHVEFEK